MDPDKEARWEDLPPELQDLLTRAAASQTVRVNRAELAVRRERGRLLRRRQHGDDE